MTAPLLRISLFSSSAQKNSGSHAHWEQSLPQQFRGQNESVSPYALRCAEAAGIQSI
jgi:hypothetical protein